MSGRFLVAKYNPAAETYELAAVGASRGFDERSTANAHAEQLLSKQPQENFAVLERRCIFRVEPTVVKTEDVG